MARLTIDNVTFGFRESEPVVDDVSWSIPLGGFHCLVGRSGCGKTTLLKIAAGLIVPNQGRIAIDGVVVTQPSQAVGLVFQTPTLLQWRTVLDNVLLPRSLMRRPTRQDRADADAVLEMVGLGTLHGRFPNELSGGQQSRVAIARALCSKPAILLMDEPFAALDALTREELQNDLVALCADTQTTVLFVTHDITEAVYLADVVAVMRAGAIAHRMAVPFARPRASDIRFGAEFNALCQQVHVAMSGAPVGEAPR
ncbi:MAG: ABC transporter ATP-binding protein [Gammaproteobacteria bacterium]|nr:ABC transporter ATP-binding protein [Gammaproteobacteria bacterium]